MNNKRIEILNRILEKRKNKGTHEIISLEAPNLKKIRETMYIKNNSEKLTQHKLAEELGIKENSLVKIEKCTEKLKFEHALKISYLYNVSLDYIYGLTDLPREEMREAKFTKNLLKIDGNTQIKKKNGNEEIKEANELILSIDKDALNCLIRLKKIEDSKNSNEISKEEYNIINSQIEKEYEDILNDMYRKYYYNDTIKFALIPIDEMNKLLNSEDEQDKIAIDTLLRIFPFVIPSNEEIPFIKINGKKYKYTKENFIKSQKEKQNKK